MKARPTKTTYTTDALSFAGQDIEYGYMLQAHTDGDLYVYFKSSNVLAAGGVVSAEGWPRLDWETGGWIAGLVAGYDKLLKVRRTRTRRSCRPTAPCITRGDLEGQRKMYMTIYERLVAGRQQGPRPGRSGGQRTREGIRSAVGRPGPRSSRPAIAACWGHYAPDA